MMKAVLFIVLVCFIATTNASYPFRQRLTKQEIQAERRIFRMSLLETKVEALSKTLAPDGAKVVDVPVLAEFPTVPPPDHSVPKPPECGNPEYDNVRTFEAPETLKTVRDLARIEWHKITDKDVKKYMCGLRGYYLRKLLPLAVQLARLENPAMPFGPLDMFFSGTPSIDSDIDVSINGQGSEFICGAFNKLFSQVWPSTGPKRTSATVFDLNVYCTNAIADKAAIEGGTFDAANSGYSKIVNERNLYSLEKCVNLDAGIAAIDQVEQHTFALSKLYLYLSKEQIDNMFKNRDGTVNPKVATLLSRAEGIFNSEVVETYKKLKIERGKLSEYDPDFADIGNDELVTLRNGINDRDLALCAAEKLKLYPQFDASKLSALPTDTEKNNYKARRCQFVKKCYALANVHALETYWCYGTLMDVLIVQQLNAMQDSSLSVHHRIDSLLENYADVSKEFLHIIHADKEVTMLYLFKKIAKYFYRFLYAYQNYLTAESKTVPVPLPKALPPMQNIYKFHKFLANARFLNVAAKAACYHISVLLGQASLRTTLKCEEEPSVPIGTLLTATAAKKPDTVTEAEKTAQGIAGEFDVTNKISIADLKIVQGLFNTYAGEVLATIIADVYRTININ